MSFCQFLVWLKRNWRAVTKRPSKNWFAFAFALTTSCNYNWQNRHLYDKLFRAACSCAQPRFSLGPQYTSFVVFCKEAITSLAVIDKAALKRVTSINVNPAGTFILGKRRRWAPKQLSFWHGGIGGDVRSVVGSLPPDNAMACSKKSQAKCHQRLLNLPLFEELLALETSVLNQSRIYNAFAWPGSPFFLATGASLPFSIS